MLDFLDSLLFKNGIVDGIIHWVLSLLLGVCIFFLGCFVFQGCSEVNIENKTAQVVEEDVQVTVVEKDYNASYTAFMKTAGKTRIPIKHDASYKVYLKYGDEDFIIDDEELYNRVNKGDEITVKYKKYLSEDGEVLKTDVEVEKGS